MIDFSQLNVHAPEQRNEGDERRRELEIAEDTAKRRQRSR